MSADPGRRLALIRCLRDSIDCLVHNRSLPLSLCYIPNEVLYEVKRDTQVTVYSEPVRESEHLVSCVISDGQLYASGEEMANSQGQWIRVKAFKTEILPMKYLEGWVLLWDSKKTSDDPQQTQIQELKPEVNQKHALLDMKKHQTQSWLDIVTASYSLNKKSDEDFDPDSEAVEKLRSIPANWSRDHDEALVHFLSEESDILNDEHLGSVKSYVESVDVSSCCDEDEGASCLTDGDADSYWESDGNQGAHWIKLCMKKGTVIKKLFLTLDGSDDNYLPYHIVVMAGEAEHLKQVNDVHVDLNIMGIHDVCVLENASQHYKVIEIRIKECKDDGIDTRIHGIKIKSTRERDVGLNIDIFKKEKCVRYPKLDGYDSEILYRRSILLQRFAVLLDSVIQYLVPEWEFSLGSFNMLKSIKPILPLSKKRLSMLDTFLRESELGNPSGMPKLFINRQSAADHKSDPSLDPECKNTVFNQIYEGLRPKNRLDKPLDYRWSSRYDQWWECKFAAEGIIDQGGGFRDSLADMGDELCPTAADTPVPLPYFIRSPNQYHEEDANRDMYIPNPSCHDYSKYHWIGQLMGACLRGKESLVLSMSPFIWKKLIGDDVSWKRDFSTVDRAEVKVMETMETIDQVNYKALFGEKVWTVSLSDGSIDQLKEHGDTIGVSCEERTEYISAVIKARMKECDEQISAIREGLLSVVPLPVLELLTWDEVEKRVSGDAEITIEALKKTSHYEDIEQTEARVKYLWEALSNFSNEDRSRFLRFVTGRRRLPAPIYICPLKALKEDDTDALPESSTCSNTVYLPNYSSAKIAEEKLRYAAYNCIAIDTDMSTWDE